MNFLLLLLLLMSPSVVHAVPRSSSVGRGLTEVLGDNEANKAIAESCESKLPFVKIQSSCQALMKKCMIRSSKDAENTLKKRADCRNLMFRVKSENSQKNYSFIFEQKNLTWMKICLPLMHQYLSYSRSNWFQLKYASTCRKSDKMGSLIDKNYSQRTYLYLVEEAHSGFLALATSSIISVLRISNYLL